MSFLPTYVGSFSQPAAENPTVVMIEAAFRHAAMDWRYLNCEVAPDGLAAAVAGARALGWAGFNCSLPHKVAVIDLIDGLGESAAIIGAVNCVVRRGERFVGENTDGRGFVASLAGVLGLPGARVVVLGAGGAARAVAVESALAGAAHITIVNRSAERAEALAALVASRTPAAAVSRSWAQLANALGGADLLVNATSIGLHPDPSCPDVPFERLDPRTVVADIVPNPPTTALLRRAAERGCRTVDGTGMLVNQGVESIRHWSGVTADAEVMRAAVLAVLPGLDAT